MRDPLKRFSDRMQGEQGDPAELLSRIYREYLGLSRVWPLDAKSGLGGVLFYAGGLSAGARSWLVAANIAGAASLVGSSDGAAIRQAMRDGVIDFAVTSLDEALRIFKNEIRKRQTVSVAVSVEAGELVGQMLERGVLPDLIGDPDGGEAGRFLDQGARVVEAGADEVRPLVCWSVKSGNQGGTRRLPRLDGLAAASISEEDVGRHRWVRLAPRYLGRAAQGVHGVGMGAGELVDFRNRVEREFAGEGGGGAWEIWVAGA